MKSSLTGNRNIFFIVSISFIFQLFYISSGAQTVVGPNNGSTFVNDASVGTVAWANPGNAKLNDSQYAMGGPLGTISCTNSRYSNYLKATGFGFSIPSGSIITGVTVEIEEYYLFVGNGAGISENSVKIVKNGAISGTEQATGKALAKAATYDSYGGCTDLWGLTWTEADINAADFGVAVSLQGIGGTVSCNSGLVNHIRITVCYDDAAGVQLMASVKAPVVYPTVSTGHFFVERNINESIPTQITVTSLEGKTIYSDFIRSGGIVLVDLSQFSDGIYFISLRSADKVLNQKILKESN